MVTKIELRNPRLNITRFLLLHRFAEFNETSRKTAPWLLAPSKHWAIKTFTRKNCEHKTTKAITKKILKRRQGKRERKKNNRRRRKKWHKLFMLLWTWGQGVSIFHSLYILLHFFFAPFNNEKWGYIFEFYMGNKREMFALLLSTHGNRKYEYSERE